MEGQEKPLFKPLGEGLGFHPYADGLPYATTSKVSQALPKSAARASVPPQFQQKQNVRPAGDWRAQLQKQATPDLSQKNTQAVVDHFVQLESREAEFGWAYLFRRCVAGVIDFFMAAVAANLLTRSLSDGIADPGVLFIHALIWIFTIWALLLAQDFVFKTSIGKWLLGLRLKGSRIRILGRSLAMIPSFGFVGVGLVWMLFHGKRRAWHDDVTGLQPTRSSS
ncbi:MAG: hypothetical protein JNL01_15715 [Bdellovibrionales bacterium]|nr:hypothetical protein [Bdellovibrionales bacterium]